MRLWAKVGTFPAEHVTSKSKKKPRIGLVIEVEREEAHMPPARVRITDVRFCSEYPAWLYIMEHA
jgi:hypothetical protein